ncbi:type II toxin-antitoxin system RelE/ParE family toxin [Desulfosporosinus sp. PR]|uniref:type II toxin-antitoxin system RelE/ParE family toxin n=1 Tax=Candidatus Desulfosporosinus nitrosoreducens TaxID=3401928 RepID=UPI0027E640D1|nr:type II toxin-antitoxin system RelE/ParE family toxin [Desulfosporosinus sp. PR]MDQ7096633.1 type II toxin-antitoxin system RelE/ParE family toxin [Desulfosporosinus sp. PR]
MTEGRYSLRYIPRFEADFNEIVDYLVFKLHNPDAAKRLINKIEISIAERLSCPLSFEPFQSNRKRRNPYYRIYVDNFTIFYVVIDNVMEVRRILYRSRDIANLIE